jgi:hypothetical protein
MQQHIAIGNLPRAVKELQTARVVKLHEAMEVLHHPPGTTTEPEYVGVHLVFRPSGVQDSTQTPSTLFMNVAKDGEYLARRP